jgi:uncharacterized protein (TIGR02147 family)
METSLEDQGLLPTSDMQDSALAAVLASTELGRHTRAAMDTKTLLELPVLRNYVDYRAYLRDWYSYKRDLTKRDLRPYSYGVFSAAADIKSPNYLKMIIEGKRNLSDDMIAKFAKALGLAKEAANEFRVLVLFGQCTDPAQRNFLLKELSDLRMQQQVKSGEIDEQALDKMPDWIGWILYAALDQEGAEFKPERLRELLRGKASESEIQDALKNLIRSGEVIQDEFSGKLMKAPTSSEAREDIPPALVRKLQSHLMYLGLESLFQDAPTEREFGSLTLSLTKSEFEELRFKLRQLRKQTHKDQAIKRMTSKGERVYQLNLQLFPVTDQVKIQN